jgi:hypothetical protein
MMKLFPNQIVSIKESLKLTVKMNLNFRTEIRIKIETIYEIKPISSESLLCLFMACLLLPLVISPKKTLDYYHIKCLYLLRHKNVLSSTLSIQNPQNYGGIICT